MSTASMLRVAGFTRHQGVLVLLVLSAAINLALATKVRSANGRPPARLTAGTPATPFSGVSLDGHTLNVDFKHGRPTVLYYFSPACGWCERNWANVKSLMERRAADYRFIGVSTSADDAALAVARGLNLEVVTGLSGTAMENYHFSGTPQTVVISSVGRVLKSWDGAFAGRIAREVEAFFDMKLPGLSSPRKKS